MPYRRRYAKKRVYKKPGYGYGWKPTISNATGAVTGLASLWSAVRGLQKMWNTEVKFFDVNQVNQSIGTTGAVYSLSQIPGGDAYNQRDGNSCRLKSQLFRLSAVLNSSADQTFVRFILFKDNEARNASPAAADLLETGNDYLSPLNHVNGKRFTVIRDKVLNLRKDMNSAVSKEYIKCSHHLKFSSATSTDVREGAMYVLLISDQVTNTPTVDFNNRLRFIDN